MTYLSRARTFFFGLWTVSALLASCSSDAAESGRGDVTDGLILTDVRPDEESFSVNPQEVVFEAVVVGETDVQVVTLVNESTAALELSDMSLTDADPKVRFANLFIVEVGERARWADLDGDGHVFDSRPEPLILAPAESLSIILQYRPDGSLFECRDRPPTPCGFLNILGASTSWSVPLFVPR